MHTRRFSVVATATLLLITACTAAPTPVYDTQRSAAGEMLLNIETDATAENDAVLHLTVQVFGSVIAADHELGEILAENCGPDFTSEQRLNDEQWGAVLIEVEAEQLGETAWPQDTPLSLVTAPTGDLGAAAITGTGAVSTPEDPAGELGPCLVPRFIDGEGSAQLVLGIRGDTAADSPTSGRNWANYRYGVQTELFGESTGVTLSGCEIELTEVGETVTLPDSDFAQTASATECSAGRDFSQVEDAVVEE